MPPARSRSCSQCGSRCCRPCSSDALPRSSFLHEAADRIVLSDAGGLAWSVALLSAVFALISMGIGAVMRSNGAAIAISLVFFLGFTPLLLLIDRLSHTLGDLTLPNRSTGSPGPTPAPRSRLPRVAIVVWVGVFWAAGRLARPARRILTGRPSAPLETRGGARVCGRARSTARRLPALCPRRRTGAVAARRRSPCRSSRRTDRHRGHGRRPCTPIGGSDLPEVVAGTEHGPARRDSVCDTPASPERRT